MSDIHTKLASIAGEIGSINKTERNKEQGFNFRSIEAITGAARPLFAKAGVSVAPKMVSLESTEVTAKSGARGFRTVVEMQYTFAAGSDDSSVTVSMPGEAVDYGDKSTSKAVQMAYKYALTQVLQVGSGDDPDATSVEAGHSAPPKRQTSTRATKPVPGTPEPDPDVELRKWVAKQKLRLVEAFDGDKEAAKDHWIGILASNQLESDDQIPTVMWRAIEDDVDSIILDNLPDDQKPFAETLL